MRKRTVTGNRLLAIKHARQQGYLLSGWQSFAIVCIYIDKHFYMSRSNTSSYSDQCESHFNVYERFTK
ncbi:hypothetical protein B5X24_HaOG210219 [Helicoverpa armigera]|uniref:Uncharacterized protein n=1 Tax=Helicoverpa armigera TaxID=29058 RepID=A0A2W1BFE2_HELAM|nr:hypothetical protein B5X24_HaOG210219 [Helicoverpa armigera]